MSTGEPEYFKYPAGTYEPVTRTDWNGWTLPPFVAAPKPWRFCPHCGEALDQAAAPFWTSGPLHETNEARVMEAESEGDD